MFPGYEEWQDDISEELGKTANAGSSANGGEYGRILALAIPQQQVMACKVYLRMPGTKDPDTKRKIEALLQQLTIRKLQNQAPIPETNNNTNTNTNTNNANNTNSPQNANVKVQIGKVVNNPRLIPKQQQPTPTPPQPNPKPWAGVESPKDAERKLNPEKQSPAEQFERIKGEKNEKLKNQLTKDFIYKNSSSDDVKILNMCKELSEAETETAYVNQAAGKEHPIYNPQGEHSFKHIDRKGREAVENNSNDPGKAGIGVYTGEAYKLINPSMANNKQWMDQKHAPTPPKRPEKPDTDDPVAMAKFNEDFARYKERVKKFVENNKEYEEHGRKERFEEGGVHAAFVMKGLKSLPSQKATLCRGERWTPQEFKQNYSKGKVLDKVSLTSMSSDHDVALHFALYGDGNVGAEKNTGAYVVAETFGGKDISGISVNPGEQERLFEAGASFVVADIIEREKDSTKYFEVRLKQVDRKSHK